MGVTMGAPDRFLLVGTILTPDQVIDGEVLVEGDRITCVEAGTACESRCAGAAGATVIDDQRHHRAGHDRHAQPHPVRHLRRRRLAAVEGLHQPQPVDDRGEATPRCSTSSSASSTTRRASRRGARTTPYGTAAGSLRCEVDKFGELKGLVAGTTSIVGLPGTSRGVLRLARALDRRRAERARHRHDPDERDLPAVEDQRRRRVRELRAAARPTAYLIHVGEGTDAKALGEFATLGSVTTTPGLPATRRRPTITHGTAFTRDRVRDRWRRRA